MQSKEKTNNKVKLCSSSVCSPIPSNSPTLGYRSFSNWPNEWGGVAYYDSGSSDLLSQSIGSSTSWSDELEGDLTASLQAQLHLVEQTLYHDGRQELPIHSPLREECKLWQQNFPHLRIYGEAVKPSVGCQTRSRHEQIQEQLEEIISAHGDSEDALARTVVKKDSVVDCSELYKEKIKKAVIDQIFLRIWPEVVKKIEPILCKVAAEQNDPFSVSPEPRLKCDSLSTELTSGFNSLNIIEDVTTRPKSGRRSGRTLSAKVPVKPIVLECSIPVPMLVNRTSSPLRRSPGRLSQGMKQPSPERLLSPLPLEARSATGRRLSRPKPQYDARTGRMINRDDSRLDCRRNLKTSPPLPWSRHVTLPPIETMDIVPKMTESKGKRSVSALFKGGKLNSNSRPNTSIATKQVVLSPLDSLQIKQTPVTTSRPWLHHYPQETYDSVSVHQSKPSDQRQRWRNRTNQVKRC
ncbi:uncharacterized protein LOC128984749 isoform X1 [Macrosteles quadrilineatus]|uniref:uncharacterized protein LOC128984749 isoform X1 n=1 Tax=Macrosteles quadrilineatus TaxID=74068 RepID=UPI0023E0CE74|nr:uncharacterized protein LOC128984749 isoform X1 [Macrosteles quadrilineatus]XP_054260072.1 uncharacterized protein LOC128984749 isoform X1 [Macrosteles quadrilineatus]